MRFHVTSSCGRVTIHVQVNSHLLGVQAAAYIAAKRRADQLAPGPIDDMRFWYPEDRDET